MTFVVFLTWGLGVLSLKRLFMGNPIFQLVQSTETGTLEAAELYLESPEEEPKEEVKSFVSRLSKYSFVAFIYMGAEIWVNMHFISIKHYMALAIFLLFKVFIITFISSRLAKKSHLGPIQQILEYPQWAKNAEKVDQLINAVAYFFLFVESIKLLGVIEG
ncbi:MAG: hypothetical protein MK193_03955 [Lentisphaeria bacterium]|nr:hypothetical protein [Lentisphaeria bacterium]